MPKTAIPPAPAAATLATQKSDFTAEGSPPPGLVLTSTPVKPRATRTVRATVAPPQRKRKAKRTAEVAR